MKSLIKKLAIASMIAMVISGGMINANEAKSETKKHPREYLTLKIDSNPKTGGFFGGEIGVELSNLYQNYDPSSNDIVSYSSLVAYRINLIGGYQWYFYNHPNFSLSVRAKGYLGYGYGKYTLRDNGNNYYYYNSNQFNIGSELQILWDFLNIDRHSLGIHFSPIGFDVNIVVDDVKYDTSKTTTNNQNPGKRTFVKTIPSYTISTGIHYYYNVNHQLFLDYKYFANNYANNHYNDDDGYFIIKRHQFTLGYSYKF